jgi:stage II sporulation protein D
MVSRVFSFYLLSMILIPSTVLSVCNVRVLLAEGEVTEPVEWLFATAQKNFLCRFAQGALFCNGKKLTKQALRIQAEDNRCSYQNTVYAGQIALVIQDGRWYVINNLPRDEYVYSVLRSESWPGWPLEVNKVFAIMVRTYAVHKIMLARQMKKKPLFDIKSTNIHQTYRGMHDFEHLHEAVDETQGVIIAYNKQPIVAMYDSCCGGIVPAQVTGFDFKTNPYLARPYACTYCSECKLFSWKIVYPQEVLLTLLQQEFPEIKSVRDLRVHTYDKAGKVLEVSLKTGRAHKKILGARMYRLCKDVRSFCYTIHQEGKQFVFTGKGFGHHMGVCQWGVRTMAKKGFFYKEILDYYYPGTVLMKLVTEPTHATT